LHSCCCDVFFILLVLSYVYLLFLWLFMIYLNCIIPYPGEQFLKITSKTAHNCKSWQSPIVYMKKWLNIFYVKSVENIGKWRIISVIRFSRWIRKNNSSRKNNVINEKEDNKKKIICTAILVVLTASQSVKRQLNNLITNKICKGWTASGIEVIVGRTGCCLMSMSGILVSLFCVFHFLVIQCSIHFLRFLIFVEIVNEIFIYLLVLY